MRIIKPPALARGAKIAVVSPAGPIDPQRLKKGMRQLEEWGFKPLPSEHASGKIAYLAADDKQRLKDLISAFEDKSVDAIFCSRGGYGTGRLLQKIPFDTIRCNPKPFVGFSDVTALNWAFFAKTGMISLSGPTVGEMGDGLPPDSLRSLRTMLGMEPFEGALKTDDFRMLRPGSTRGRVFPGCLSMIVTLLGTPFLPDLTGAILVIEDVAEKPYRIDRTLTHLKNAGILQQISGLIVGSMVDCWPKTNRGQHLTLDDILLDLTADHPIPIGIGFPYGHHISRVTLPIGVEAELSENGLYLLEKSYSV